MFAGMQFVVALGFESRVVRVLVSILCRLNMDPEIAEYNPIPFFLYLMHVVQQIVLS